MIFDLFNRRSLENPATPITSAALLSLLNSGSDTTSGIAVTEGGSPKMSAVYRAVSLISNLGGAMPLHVYDSTTKKIVPSRLLDDPHPDMTPYDIWKLTYVHRFLWGNSYQQKVRDSMGRVVELWPMSPWKMAVGRVKPSDDNPSGKIFKYTGDDGKITGLTSREVFHIPGMSYDGTCGMSVISFAANAIGLSFAAETAAGKLFTSGNMLGGILQTEQRINQEQAETLQERWRARFQGAANAHEVAVLDSGATFNSMTMPANDAQMLESREFEITEIARFAGVPPYLLFQTDKSTSWGTGLEQQATGFVVFDLWPGWFAPTEQRITKNLLLDVNRVAKYKLEALLRGDSVARAEFYNVMRMNGVYSANDIRELEDMPPIEEGGDTYIQPMNMVPLGTKVDPNAQKPVAGGPGADQAPGAKKPAPAGAKK